MKKTKKACISKFGSRVSWLKGARVREIREFVAFIEYQPTPEVLGDVFTTKFWDQGYTSALGYFYSELIGKVFPLPVYIAESLAKRVDLHTWNGVSILKKESLKLIRASPNKIYLFGTEHIKDIVAFMTFIPETKTI